MPGAFLIRAALLFLTGAAALAFELALVRTLSVLLGNTVQAAGITIGSFLLALALGAVLFGGRADRLGQPIRLFAFLALLAGVATLLVPALVALADELAAALGAREWGDRRLWLLPGAMLAAGLPGVLLGGTLPALVADQRPAPGERHLPGVLYALNTLGAVAGALLTGFVLLETLGTSATMRLAALGMMGAGAGALLLSRGLPIRPPVDRAPEAPDRTPFGLWFAAIASGYAALALEVIGTRLLMQYLPSSAHSFAAVLTMFLLGISLGGVLGSALVRRGVAIESALSGLLAALSVATLAVGPVVVAVGDASGLAIVDPIWKQLLFAAVLLPATVASGAVFAVLLGAFGVVRPARHVGRVTLVNTVGGLLGSILTAFLWIPSIGAKHALLLAGILPLVAGLLHVGLTRRIGWILAAAAAAAVLPFLDLRAVPPDPYLTELVAYREGPSANVAVLESPVDRDPVLFINRTTKQGGGERAKSVERRQGLIPAALHGGVHSALVLGVGTGRSLSALLDTGASAVDAVELVDSVIELLPLFADRGGDLRLRPGVEFRHEDAVFFTRNAKTSYDLILGDLFFPWLDGSGSLFALEHFRAVRERLNPGGLFCQWIPLHQMRWEDFGLICRTFTRAFPEQTMMFLADPRSPFPVLGLVGSVEPLRIVPGELEARFADPRKGAPFREVGFERPEDLLELFVGDQYTIEANFGGAKALGEEKLVNTLDRPIIEYRAARTVEDQGALALNNQNNLALYLGGSIGAYLEFPERTKPEERAAYELTVNRRVSALRSYLIGSYWRRRVALTGEDAVGHEQIEASKYVEGLVFEPAHPVLNEAAAELSERRLADRRYQQVVAFAAEVLNLNPGNVEVARNLGLAQLLLGEPASAVRTLEHAVSLDEGNAYNTMVLGIALYDLGEDDRALETLTLAQSLTGQELSRLALAIGFAVKGDAARAQENVEPMLDHPIWGVLARRAKARFEAQ